MNREASIDSMGRICLPKDFLKKLDWKLSSKDIIEKVNITLSDDCILITQKTPLKCKNCGEDLKYSFKFCPECGKEV